MRKLGSCLEIPSFNTKLKGAALQSGDSPPGDREVGRDMKAVGGEEGDGEADAEPGGEGSSDGLVRTAVDRTAMGVRA